MDPAYATTCNHLKVIDLCATRCADGGRLKFGPWKRNLRTHRSYIEGIGIAERLLEYSSPASYILLQ